MSPPNTQVPFAGLSVTNFLVLLFNVYYFFYCAVTHLSLQPSQELSGWKNVVVVLLNVMACDAIRFEPQRGDRAVEQTLTSRENTKQWSHLYQLPGLLKRDIKNHVGIYSETHYGNIPKEHRQDTALKAVRGHHTRIKPRLQSRSSLPTTWYSAAFLVSSNVCTQS